MPSNSYMNFERNLIKDVERLYDSHGALNHAGRGKRGLGHITRSGIFMLCAAWEVYHEELVKESVRIVATNTSLPRDLPKSIKTKLINYYDSLKDRSKLLSIYVIDTKKGEKLDRHSVHYKLKEYGKKAGIPKKVGPHLLRKTCATYFAVKGAKRSDIKRLLRHSDYWSQDYYVNLSKMAKNDF